MAEALDKVSGNEEESPQSSPTVSEGNAAESRSIVSNQVTHQFWDTQPVPKISDSVEDCGPVKQFTVEETSQEPYPTPPGYEWVQFDINDDAQADEVYTLLHEHYLESSDGSRLHYSIDYLRWALCPPGYFPQLHLGMRNIESKELVACITAVPLRVKVRDSEIPMQETSFLCVHKKLRSKRLAPLLIKEITRRSHLLGIFQAVFTGVPLTSKPVAVSQYHVRPINPSDLFEKGYFEQSDWSKDRILEFLQLPENPQCAGIRAMEAADCKSACELLNTYLQGFNLYQVFSLEEFTHFFLPKERVVDTFVIADSEGKVTDMCSFYHLPGSFLHNGDRKTRFGGYLFYNVATTVSMTQLMNDNMTFARNLGLEELSALDIMGNGSILKELKFVENGVNLNYYLHNWKCPAMQPNEVGLVPL